MDINKEQRKLKIAIVSLPENDFRFPLIGTMIITRYVKEHCKNVEVLLIDNTFDNIFDEIRKLNPDIVGFSTFTQSYKEAIKFAKEVKKINPEVKIVIGGPHITTLPDSLDSVFDYGVIGEGERAFVELIEAIRHHKNVGNIKGLIYYKNNKLVLNKKREDLSNIDELFPLDYGLLNKKYFEKKFIPEIYKFEVSMGLMTSIGCPYNCRFCSIKACWKRIRFRNIDSVIEEIKNLYYNFGVRHIDLFDDLFSVNKARLNEFREKLECAGLLGKLTFSCQARANTIDEEMCKILKSLNIKTVVFGFESGSDRVLKYIKNDLSLSAETNKNAIKLCVKHGLNVYGCLMIGMPGEKLEDMQKTLEFIDFAKKAGAARLWIQVIIPLPSTEMWEIAKQRGKIDDNVYEHISNVYHKESPLLLDADVPLEEFIKKYDAAKKKCRSFVYQTFIKTLIGNPSSLLYFTKESIFYLKRLFNFVKQ